MGKPRLPPQAREEELPQEESGYFSADDDLTEVDSGDSSQAGGLSNRLTWRGEPSQTFADWTVVVVVTTDTTKSYLHHVHKTVMCHGPRSSRFFGRIMAKKAEQSTTSQRGHQPTLPSTKVELSVREASNFAIMLDFMYAAPATGSSSTVATGNSTISLPSLVPSTSSSSEDAASIMALVRNGQMDAESAISLRHLARVFEVDALMSSVNKFIQQDLSITTALTYLVLSHEYQDKRLFDSAMHVCRTSFTKLDQRSISKLPLQTFRILIRSFESFKEDDKDQSLFLSEAVCRFMEKNKKMVNSKLLLEFTDTLLMPYITSEAAIGFTALVKALNPEDAKANWEALVRLCRRCAQTVVQEYGWSDFSVDGAVDEYLGHSVSVRSEVNCVDSLLFATSFAAALTQAQTDYGDIASSQTDLEGMVGSLYQTIDVLEKANERKDRYMATQDAAIAESRKQVSDLEKEVRALKEELENQKELASQAQFSLKSYASTPKASSKRARTPSSKGMERRYGTPPRPSRSIPSARPEMPLTPTQAEDPAIRDLVSPSTVQTEIRGRSTRGRDLSSSLQEMRSIPLA